MTLLGLCAITFVTSKCRYNNMYLLPRKGVGQGAFVCQREEVDSFVYQRSLLVKYFRLIRVPLKKKKNFSV